ncbi:MAG: hypothetical protein A2498_00030 [Lentisphaerae bacterium RIFOXYC12_FULL_60_16]|nr:MAG: hypothetical protein A2498_00030 [Lentisphaerae bacterium RIFOXYC12_FULL_60_16]OGV69948.1 MAG: hypothetical protein A2269_09475 [Lentisphaerae bacterium RIFOXYA12_FULL_60_10]OGV84342.1 MAG: hypothetical protein A2340_07960 [Lentisphaerae bacterium RIFOXYB12_FULL_60_10]
MELTDLGFDRWFETQAAPLLQPGQCLARVTAVDRGACLIRNQEAETYAELAGKFRFAVETAVDRPCVGDWVCVQCHASGGPAIIHGVVPRKTFLRRKCPGKTVDFQMIATNIDIAFHLAFQDRFGQVLRHETFSYRVLELHRHRTAPREPSG